MSSFRQFFTMIILAVSITAAQGSPSTYFVSLQGNDSNPGTEAQPFRTIPKAVGVAVAGDTILVRGGTYISTTTISISKSGTADKYFTLKSYPGERALLNYSTQAMGSRAISLSGSYWHIEGFDVFGAGDNGLMISGGSHNRIVNCAFYRNRDSGLQMGNGASYNEVINCDSYFNADPTDYGDADGFAAKLDVGVQNYFYGCRSWKNCDDGWDGYLRGADNVSTILENCWAFENGYLEDGTDPGAQANGNGFKMGGSDNKDLRHDFTVKNCLAFNNKVKGFDQNNNMGSMILYNCSSFNNAGGNYKISRALADGEVLIIKNSLVLGDLGSLGDFAVQEANSWLPPFESTIEDYISIDPAAAYGPRKADGSLPDITFMHLAEGSDLIDGGVDVGLPFDGEAPDLGCFETVVPDDPDPTGTTLTPALTCKLWPNPASTSCIVNYSTGIRGMVSIVLFDLTGRQVLNVDAGYSDGGKGSVVLDLSCLPKGVYIYRLQGGNTALVAGKLLVR
ncbi:MAG: right-handed parallel beta-helix repeat-containing protein [Bacteroidota bacterium]